MFRFCTLDGYLATLYAVQLGQIFEVSHGMLGCFPMAADYSHGMEEKNRKVIFPRHSKVNLIAGNSWTVDRVCPIFKALI